MNLTPSFELNFRPTIALASVVRRFVTEFYAQFSTDPDATSRIALATHELLENAAKYSTNGETWLRIELDRSTTPGLVRIVLRNRATPEHIAAIREVIEGASNADDVFVFYLELIKHRAKIAHGSGLGLARICAEGEMNLAFEVVDDVTVIRATGTC